MSETSTLRSMQEACLEALTQIRDEVESLFSRYGSESLAANATLKQLFWYLSSRSQAVSFLISNGYPWDAEMILRAFYEAAAKILFICFSDDAEKFALVDEFWRKLEPISDRRTARKAAFAEQLFEKSSVSASVFAVLQDGSLFNLEPEGSKLERKRLEQKWSFSEIVANLEHHAAEGKPLKGIKALLHIYGMASHLIHADGSALDLMYDRATRDPEARKTVEAGQISRIMSDQVSIAWLCAEALRQHYRGEFSADAKLRDALNRALESGEAFQVAFEKSQKEFFSRHRHV